MSSQTLIMLLFSPDVKENDDRKKVGVCYKPFFASKVSIQQTL